MRRVGAAKNPVRRGRPAGAEPDLLDPERDSARIRAFFVHPDRSRQGLARRLLERCEAEAITHGFRAAALMATLTGERFYRQFGYTGEAAVEYPLPGGQIIRFVPMRKDLVRVAAGSARVGNPA